MVPKFACACDFKGNRAPLGMLRGSAVDLMIALFRQVAWLESLPETDDNLPELEKLPQFSAALVVEADEILAQTRDEARERGWKMPSTGKRPSYGAAAVEFDLQEYSAAREFVRRAASHSKRIEVHAMIPKCAEACANDKVICVLPGPDLLIALLRQVARLTSLSVCGDFLPNFSAALVLEAGNCLPETFDEACRLGWQIPSDSPHEYSAARNFICSAAHRSHRIQIAYRA